LPVAAISFNNKTYFILKEECEINATIAIEEMQNQDIFKSFALMKYYQGFGISRLIYLYPLAAARQKYLTTLSSYYNSRNIF